VAIKEKIEIIQILGMVCIELCVNPNLTSAFYCKHNYNILIKFVSVCHIMCFL